MGQVPSRGAIAPCVALAGAGLVEIWVTPARGLNLAQRVGESTALVAVCSILMFRLRWPVGTGIAALAALAVPSLLWTDSRAYDIALVILVSYSGARQAHRSGALLVLLAAEGYAVLVMSLEESSGFWSYLANFLFISVLMILIPWAAGMALRRRQNLSRHDADRAVEEERLRLARELHDVVGHALGVIIVQAEGERAQLSVDAPDSTQETLSAITQTARYALDDVRRLLQVMRTAATEPRPQPGLKELEQLRDEANAAGLPTEIEIEGEPRPLPPALDLSAYRVVQEALTNTLRHSRDAQAHVVLRYLDEAISITVEDSGRAVPESGPHGFGLAGMRERVALFDGDLETGPRPGGGFVVRARLPMKGGTVDESSRPRV
jgi:signal transduction histidine kinase